MTLLALLFGLAVAGSLLTSTALYLDILPGSPLVLSVVGTLHLLFGWFFLHNYLAYRALHRLVSQGRGELFELAISDRIARARLTGFRDHFRLRRIQGLALAGLPRQALDAADDFRHHGEGAPAMIREALAAEAAANLELGQPFWTQAVLARAEALGASAAGPELRAMRARLRHLGGDPAGAAVMLTTLTRGRRLGWASLAFVKVERARNLLWLGEALAAAGKGDEAAGVFARASRAAPASVWGARAARALSGAPAGQPDRLA